ALLFVQTVGDDDLDRHEEVGVAALGARAALAPQPERLPRRCSRRDLEPHRLAVECGDLDLGAQSGFGEGDGDREGEVVGAPPEDLVRLHVNREEEVAGRPTLRARAALALEPDAPAISDAGGDPHRDTAWRHAGTGTSTGSARRVHDLAG